MKKLLTLLIMTAFCATVYAGSQLMYLPFNDSMNDAVHNEAPSVVTGNSLADPDRPAPSLVADGVYGTGSLNYLDSAEGMGDGFYGGYVRYGSPAFDSDLETALNDLESFTIMGWFNTKDDSVQIGNNARLFNRNGGIGVLSNPNGLLRLGVNNSWVSSGQYSWGSKNMWVFFAISYDGTSSANNVKFYRGFTNWSDAELVSTVTLDKGTVTGGNGTPIVVGNNYYSESGAVKPFDGYLDEFRIYGSKEDASGVLDLEGVTAYMNNIPEPATLSLLGLGLLSLRKRRKN